MAKEHPLPNALTACFRPEGRSKRAWSLGLERSRVIRYSALATGPSLWLLMSVALWLAAPLGAAPLSTNLPPLTAPLPGASLSVIRVLGALALVLALFLGAVWLFRNWQRVTLPRGGRSPRLQILETRALGQRHLLFVVAYEEQRMLLATSPGGVSLVSHLSAAETLEAPPEKISSPGFIAALQEAVQRKA